MAISFVAYLSSLDTELSGFENSSLDIEASDNNTDVVNIDKPKPDVDGDSKLNKKLSISINDLDNTYSTRYKLYKVDNGEDIKLYIVKSIPKPDKTLYDGFVEKISNIHENDTVNNIDKSSTKDTVFTSSTKSSSTTKTNVSISADNTKDNSYPFTPTTLEALDNRLQ